MVEVKVGQKWKSTDWWTQVVSEKTVEITAVEGETVSYTPGMFSVVEGYDDAGLDTWEERWELVEDVVENKFNVGDKVRTLCDYANLWKEGEEGLIQRVRASDEACQVYFPGQDDWWWVKASNLELVEEEVNDFDPVERPAHYNQGKFEVIDVIEDWGLDKNYFLGNVIKYVARSSHKGNEAEDLKKARFYLNRYIDSLES